MRPLGSELSPHPQGGAGLCGFNPVLKKLKEGSQWKVMSVRMCWEPGWHVGVLLANSCVQWHILSQLEFLTLSHLPCVIPFRVESVESPDTAPSGGPAADQPSVVPTQGDLLGDLLNLDLGPPVSGPPMATSSVQMGAVDLLGGGLDTLVRPSSRAPSLLPGYPVGMLALVWAVLG